MSKFITMDKIISGAKTISFTIDRDRFKPDVIIGLARGGLVLAQFLAYDLEVKNVETVSLQFRDNPSKLEEAKKHLTEVLKDKNSCLITDDLIDSGKTLKECYALIKECNPTIDIRFAVSYFKKIDLSVPIYFGEITQPGWLTFPWD